MARFAELFRRLSTVPQEKGVQFERIAKWLLQNDPVYRCQLDEVWLWAEWPGRWGAEAGIDLVAKDRQGQLWAVQAKAYNPNLAISKTDINAFIAEASQSTFSNRLLIGTTDRLHHIARRTLEREHVALLLRSQLEKMQVEWPNEPHCLLPAISPPLMARPHQREAVEAIVAGLTSQPRGQLIMACGTGKTLVGVWVAEALQAESCLVLLPSLTLLAKTMREWARGGTRRPSFLAVCSDETVRDHDDLVARVTDLGQPVTTNPDRIASFLQGSGPRVVFATYHSSPVVGEASRSAGTEFDLVIADEAHRCAGRLGAEFTTVLDGTQIRAKRRLFMTATPRFIGDRARRKAERAGLEVVSMSDERRFGAVMHQLPFKEAIERDLITDYRVLVIGVDEPSLRSFAEGRRLVTLEGADLTDAATLATQVAVMKALRSYGLRKLISFHGRVRRAREFAESMKGLFDWMPLNERPDCKVWSGHVNGSMPSSMRDAALDRLAGANANEACIVTNARCLSEGVDVPALDGVIFVDPRRSVIDIIQAVGRALRKSPEKRLGSVVVPVFLGSEDDAETALERSDFEAVWLVLKALRAHDQALADELDALRIELGRHPSARCRVPSKIVLDLPIEVDERFRHAFELRLVERSTTSWEFMFGLLRRFCDRTGHATVASKHLEDGYPLGSWANTQRALRRKGLLNAERAAKLESILTWSWNPRLSKWDRAFNAVVEFAKARGHSNVPQGYTIDGTKLGAWVTLQRMRFSHGRLSAERIARLQSLGDWSWAPRDESWERHFSALLRFVQREGHALVPQDHVEEGLSLGSWVTWQRMNHRKGVLGPDRVARLREVPGWAWDSREARWEEAYRLLRIFVERERNAGVPLDHQEAGFRLGYWVANLRAAYARQRHRRQSNCLTPERIERLESLRDWTWSPQDAAWERGIRALCDFIRRKGHALVRQNQQEADGFRLGVWVNTTRTQYWSGKLSEARIKQLESMPEWKWVDRPRRKAKTSHRHEVP